MTNTRIPVNLAKPYKMASVMKFLPPNHHKAFQYFMNECVDKFALCGDEKASDNHKLLWDYLMRTCDVIEKKRNKRRFLKCCLLAFEPALFEWHARLEDDPHEWELLGINFRLNKFVAEINDHIIKLSL